MFDARKLHKYNAGYDNKSDFVILYHDKKICGVQNKQCHGKIQIIIKSIEKLYTATI